MNHQTLKLLYFSPTGTTKAVVQGIATGIDYDKKEVIDITRPEGRQRTLCCSENDLIIVGVPVYMGRVPALIVSWLNEIKTYNTPAVSVVVYGNREYDNALLELNDILKNCGCIIVAAAAYIGEHSFSTPDIPIAAGRPDAKDLYHAGLFGRRINDRIKSLTNGENISPLDIRGSYPYGGVTRLWDVDFIDVSNDCIHCGICSEVCPVGAISKDNSRLINVEKCITCCACIRNCPENARSMKPGLVKDAAKRLNNLYKERKEPDFFM